MCLKDRSGVVSETTDHRSVEGNPVGDAIGINEIEQSCKLRDGRAVATECGCKRVQIVNPECGLDGGHCISAEPLLGQLCGDDVFWKFVHFVDDDASGGKGVTRDSQRAENLLQHLAAADFYDQVVSCQSNTLEEVH